MVSLPTKQIPKLDTVENPITLSMAILTNLKGNDKLLSVLGTHDAVLFCATYLNGALCQHYDTEIPQEQLNPLIERIVEFAANQVLQHKKPSDATNSN